MKFTIEINCDNEAFTINNGPELKRILKHILTELMWGVEIGETKPIKDINGNTVGK